MRRVRVSCLLLALGVSACSGRDGPRSAGPTPLPVAASTGAQELRAPDSFAGIADRAERSRALFLEASRVLTHPRCVNCHPDGDSPLQGMAQALHDPPVTRGADGRGVVGMECESCHQGKNAELARVPGAPLWHLAPRAMAWVGKTPRAICEQLKDPARNGGKTLAQIVEHNQHDALVAWGWSPGADREPAPGNQQVFGLLVAAWVESGAECPEERKP